MTAPLRETLDVWTARVCVELNLDPASVATTPLLDAARDVAHGVARPAAPLTTFLVGLAAGRDIAGGASAEDAVTAAVETVCRMAAEWVAEQAALDGAALDCEAGA